MVKVIKLRVRKELNSQQQLNIIKLKGLLISKGYTEIIHILDQDEEFYINSFEATLEANAAIKEFITLFIEKENLADTITFCK